MKFHNHVFYIKTFACITYKIVIHRSVDIIKDNYNLVKISPVMPTIPCYPYKHVNHKRKIHFMLVDALIKARSHPIFFFKAPPISQYLFSGCRLSHLDAGMKNTKPKTTPALKKKKNRKKN